MASTKLRLSWVSSISSYPRGLQSWPASYLSTRRASFITRNCSMSGSRGSSRSNGAHRKGCKIWLFRNKAKLFLFTLKSMSKKPLHRIWKGFKVGSTLSSSKISRGTSSGSSIRWKDTEVEGWSWGGLDSSSRSMRLLTLGFFTREHSSSSEARDSAFFLFEAVLTLSLMAGTETGRTPWIANPESYKRMLK